MRQKKQVEPRPQRIPIALFNTYSTVQLGASLQSIIASESEGFVKTVIHT